MNDLGLRLILVASLPFLLLSGCTKSGTNLPGNQYPDLSSTDDAGDTADMTSTDDGGDADGAPPPPQGTLLASGNIEIVDVMPDNTVIYLDLDTKISLNAIPLAGGTPTVIDADVKLSDPAAATDDSFQVSGGVVGLWTAVDASGNSKLQIWTVANGLKDAAAIAPAADVIAGSSDGTRVAYIQKSGTADQLAISLTTFAVATPPFIIVPALGRGTATTACDPDFSFSGQFLFSATCTGTATTAQIARTTDVGPVLKVVTGHAPIVNADDAGDRVFSWTRPGVARAYSISAAGTVSSIAVDSGIASGVISPDGATVVYTTTGGALKSANTTGTASPVTMVAAGGVMSLQGITPDFKTVVSNTLAPNADQDVDLQWSSVGMTTAPTSLVATATGELDGFTATSSHVFYIPDTSTPVLKVRALTTGAPEVDLGSTIFAGSIPSTTKVVLGANFQSVMVGTASVDVLDVQELDVAGMAPPATIVTAVQASTSDGELNFRAVGNKLLFVQVADGLYVTDLP